MPGCAEKLSCLLGKGTMGWAVPLLSLRSCVLLGRFRHLSVPNR